MCLAHAALLAKQGPSLAAAPQATQGTAAAPTPGAHEALPHAMIPGHVKMVVGIMGNVNDFDADRKRRDAI